MLTFIDSLSNLKIYCMDVVICAAQHYEAMLRGRVGRYPVPA